MKVVSLFDGMSCGQIALRELGVVPEIYYASEIDRHAIGQTQLNFPDTVQLGDVTRWQEWDIDWTGIDLILAGSPCQGFSFAGKMLAFDDPRSRLFFVFADILNHARAANPRVRFLLENVNMKKEHLRVITEYVGVFPVRINSALVSAQNRDRWYWTNIRTRQEGLFGELYSDIPQPTDRRILLRDILENEVSGKYYLNDNMLNWLKKHAAKQGTSIRIKLCNDKIGCLTSAQFKMNLSSDYVLQLPHGKSRGGVHVNKTPTLSANAWEQNNLMIQLNCNKEFGTQPRQQNRIYSRHGKSPALAAGHGGQTSNVLDDVRVRHLTPLECARLQTVPDWYRWRCSDTQIYRMLGNGWTVEVIMHILSFWDRINRERQRLCGDLKEK